MSYPENEWTEFDISFDFPFIFRTIRKWLIVIVSMAVIAGVTVYIGADLMLKDTYSVSANIAIAPRQNTAAVLSDRAMTGVMEQNVSMWNGKVLMKAIKERHPDWEINGTISAQTIPGTNLLSLVVTEQSAEGACALMNAALESSADISDSYSLDYYNVLLTHDILRTLRVSHKSVSKLAAAAFLLVVCGFGGLIGVWSIFTGVIHNEYQARRLLTVPLFESLPEVKQKRNEKSPLLSDSALPIFYLEAFDRLAARVESQMRFSKQKILMVTSVQANEGKTTIAVHLARRLAQRGKKTLLVDLDLRNPTLCRFFSQEKKSDFISGMEKNAPAYRMSELTNRQKNLDVLMQCTPVEDADRILESIDLGTKLRELAVSYDYLILDTPPIAPVRDTDIIADMADCALLVIRQDRDSASVINDACDELEEHELVCSGAVLNRVQHPRRFRRQKGYSGANRYGYGKEGHL